MKRFMCKINSLWEYSRTIKFILLVLNYSLLINNSDVKLSALLRTQTSAATQAVSATCCRRFLEISLTVFKVEVGKGFTVPRDGPISK